MLNFCRFKCEIIAVLMALDLYKLHIPDNIPPGQFASKLIKAVYTDTKDTVFPRDGVYGKDWKHAISCLNIKKRKAFDHSETHKEKSSNLTAKYPSHICISGSSDKVRCN